MRRAGTDVERPFKILPRAAVAVGNFLNCAEKLPVAN